jgi:hypothetical protein
MIAVDDLARQNHALDIEDGQSVCVHLFFRMQCHDVLPPAYALTDSVQSPARHTGILRHFDETRI